MIFLRTGRALRTARRGAGAVLLGGVLLAASCGEPVDLVESLDIVDVTTGWFDAGIVDQGMNKLVPTISMRLRNVGPEEIRGSLQINVVFRRLGEEEEWSSAFMASVARDLAPGEESDPIVLRADLGYTGVQPRAEMLLHQEFVDAEASIFVRYGGAQWVLVDVQPIERQLLTD